MEKLQTNIILEILGRPPEHIKEALNTLTAKLGSENGIKIIEKTIHEPIPVKDSKDLFTTFADITLELESLINYFSIIFSYMPSHIELINPEKIILTNIDFNDLGNKLIQRMHDYDAITKKALNDNKILMEKLQEVAPHLFNQPQQIKNQADTAKKTKSKKSLKKKR